MGALTATDSLPRLDHIYGGVNVYLSLSKVVK